MLDEYDFSQARRLYMTTTNKVQVGDSTTGTSTSTTYTINSKPQAERGWECPRCGRINAPWKSQCDCSGYNWYHTWDYKEPWWKQVYCDSDTFKVHPETTTWKAPSSVCGSDSATTAVKSNPDDTIYTTATNPVVGGSDYWNPNTNTWENVSTNVTNTVNDMVNRIDHITTTTFYNTGDKK